MTQGNQRAADLSVAKDSAQPGVSWVLLGAASLSLLLMLWAGCWTLASVFSNRAVAILGASQNTAVSEKKWGTGLALLATASDLNPLNADYPVYQGYFSHLRGRALTGQNRGQSVADDSAAKFYRRALVLRPHAGHIWAQYATALDRNGGQVQNTLYALERALTFAPYQPAVANAGVTVGVAHWQDLNAAQQQLVAAAIDYLLQHQPRYVE